MGAYDLYDIVCKKMKNSVARSTEHSALVAVLCGKVWNERLPFKRAMLWLPCFAREKRGGFPHICLICRCFGCGILFPTAKDFYVYCMFMYMVFFFVFGILIAGEQTDHLLPDLLHLAPARALSLEDPQPPWITKLFLCV